MKPAHSTTLCTAFFLGWAPHLPSTCKPTLITKPISLSTITKGETMKLHKIKGHHQLLSLFIALVFAVTLYPSKAQAQIIGDMEANIPFPFHAGNVRLPAGRYFIHVLDNTDLTVMEISSADGTTTALFDVQAAQANSAPAKSELIFNKYGNRYFLARLFEEGNQSGSEVPESRYEKRVGKAALEAQEHVPAHRREQQGS